MVYETEAIQKNHSYLEGKLHQTPQAVYRGIKTSNKNPRTEITSVYQSFRDGDIDAAEAAERMLELSGGITRLDYTPGLKFTIRTPLGAISLPHDGGKEDLSLVAKLNAYTNGKSRIQLGKGASSKHHTDGLEAVLVGNT